MSRQHANPVLLSADGGVTRLYPDALGPGGVGMGEDRVQELVHAHPAILPIDEIDAAFASAVPVCRELPTPAGPIDNFLVTSTGLPVLVECKLWRNPQARREVVGQILDYAKELARWSSADVQRAVAQVLGGGPDALIETVRGHTDVPDEAAFHDELSRNLRRGRCLLLIVGDGIREGAEAIFDYLGDHAALHFSLGLVELPVFALPEGDRLIIPRILARTTVQVREVVQLPEGMGIERPRDAASDGPDPETVALGDDRQAFWEGFLERLSLDDPEQPVPRAPRQGWIAFNMPEPKGKCWLTVYREVHKREVGLFLSYEAGSDGERVVRALIEGWDEVGPAIGGHAQHVEKNGRIRIEESRRVGDLSDPAVRDVAFAWLAQRTNVFVNALRPRIRSVVAEIADDT